jgi:hypothetical protein
VKVTWLHPLDAKRATNGLYRAPASSRWMGCQDCGSLSRKSFMARRTSASLELKT